MTLPFDIVTRKAWGAAPAGHMMTQARPLEVFVHHTDSEDAARISTRKQQINAMRAIQHYHMTEKDWSDIGYTFVVFEPDGNHEHATVFAGRSVVYVPAAQLGHNTNTMAVAIYGDGERAPMHRNTRFAIECLIREFAPDARCVGGHRNVVDTECPGLKFYLGIPTIARAVGLPTYASLHR